MHREIYPGQIYRHFKDKLYQIVAVAKHSETGEKLIVYQQLYGEFEVYVRPYDMFMSEVDREKYPDVEQKYRFELVEKNSENQIAIGTGNAASKIELNSEIELNSDEDSVSLNNIFETNDNNSKSNYIVPNEKISEGVIPEEAKDVNPILLKFLEADTYEEKREILIAAREDMTDRLIDDIAASMDVSVDEGDMEERFSSLMSCVAMLSKYEINRLR